MKQYRIENCLIGGQVVVNLQGLNQREVLIPSKGFIFLKEEELSWVLSQSKVFQRGILRVVNKDELPEEILAELPITKDAVTAKDIKFFLELPITKFVKEIKEITREDFLQELLKESNEADLPVKFIKAVEKRIEELLLERGL